jgi:hypothetical protein
MPNATLSDVVGRFSPLRQLAAVWRPIERRLAVVGLRLMRPWERLSVPMQIAIAFPTLSVLLFLLHLGPLNQPPIRAAFYGVFWSTLATPAVIIATRNELRKRHERDTPDQPSATD